MNALPRKSVIAALCFAAITSMSAAAPKLDLDRTKPVAADQTIPLTDFYRSPQLDAPAINLAGTHIAARITVGGDRYSLVVYDLATQKADVVATPADRDVNAFWWAGDRHLVYTLSARKQFGSNTAVMITEVGKVDHSNPIIQSGGARVVRVPEANPLQPLIWMSWGTENGRDEGVSVINGSLATATLVDLLSVNVTDSDYSNVKDWNRTHVIENIPVPPGGLTMRYLCDNNEALAYAITSNDGVETLQRLVGRTWEKCPVNLDEIEIVDAGNRPGELVVLGPRQPDKARALQFMDAATGKLGEVLLQDPEYDFNGTLYRDRVQHKIIGLRYQRSGPRVIWFNENALNIQKFMDGLYKDQIVTIVDYNRDMSRLVIAHYTDRQPVVYEWVDLEKKAAGPLSQTRPWIDPARMQPTQMFKFKTKDGRKLDAYITLPRGASPQHPVPLVVIPHDGPDLRDEWGFDGESQFLASRGYAVLRPNYRGSPGLNWAFPLEDEWDYVKMHEDVTAATNAVLRTKLIDRTRIGIMGTGFGGTLAADGVANEPELYRCAVMINGIYDWSARVAETSYSRNVNPYHGWMLRRLGDPVQNKAQYDAISPQRRADQIKAPVFVVFDKASSPVEIGQPNALLAALDTRHVAHEEEIVKDEVHGFGYLDKKMAAYERIEAFLARALTPSPAPVAAANAGK